MHFLALIQHKTYWVVVYVSAAQFYCGGTTYKRLNSCHDQNIYKDLLPDLMGFIIMLLRIRSEMLLSVPCCVTSLVFWKYTRTKIGTDLMQMLLGRHKQLSLLLHASNPSSTTRKMLKLWPIFPWIISTLTLHKFPLQAVSSAKMHNVTKETESKSF